MSVDKMNTFALLCQLNSAVYWPVENKEQRWGVGIGVGIEIHLEHL